MFDIRVAVVTPTSACVSGLILKNILAAEMALLLLTFRHPVGKLSAWVFLTIGGGAFLALGWHLAANMIHLGSFIQVANLVNQESNAAKLHHPLDNRLELVLENLMSLPRKGRIGQVCTIPVKLLATFPKHQLMKGAMMGQG
jgi:hypothetical protein